MTIDSHCHLHDEKFAGDLDEVLSRAQAAEITHFISIGCDLQTTRDACKKAEQYDNIYFSAGFHPHEAQLANDETLTELEHLATHAKCVAIGECGLDYYYLHSPVEDQKRAFSAQLEIASKLNLPVVIHLRDAFDDCVALLKNYPSIHHRCVIHCFSGTLLEAKTFEQLGCYISISGIITFKKPGDLPAVAQQIPRDRLLVETDAPYLAPHPHRGARNEPAFINLTIEAIAKAQGENVVTVTEQLRENTIKFFNLPRQHKHDRVS